MARRGRLPALRRQWPLALLLMALGGALAPGAAAAVSSAADRPSAAPAPQDLTALHEQLRRHDYRAARPALAALLRLPSPDEAQRELIYRWLFASENLAELARRSAGALQDTAPGAADLLAAGRLALELRELARAEACFQRLLEQSQRPDPVPAAALAAAEHGLGRIAYQRRDYEGALRLHQAGLARLATADGQLALAETLVRLGRTEAAVAAAEAAVALDPDHEQAHYLLGNGYARLNYSELAARDPAAFAAAQLLIGQASAAFGRGEFLRARGLATAALRRCPGHGRAHAVLAKAAESLRLLEDPQRAADERRFAASAMPAIPGIERYVLNWAQLSPRHRKRVALSLAPWRAFIPVLAESGATHFIKPLHLRLSETPGGRALRDQRIGYDSRLWDDVRGMGGFSTVTGIEDVERSIFGRYNTVLHELSHQVHGVLTAAQSRQIQALYSQAKQRDEAAQTRGESAFLSRYAGGSVWEYFAEGANALDSPRRGEFDTREIVRERLQAMDPDLQALVAGLFAQRDTRASRPIALVNAGHQQLERGALAPALRLFERALALAPGDELVLGARLYGLSLAAGSADGAMRLRRAAEAALQRLPGSGTLALGATEALWHAGRPLPQLVQELAARTAGFGGEDRYRAQLALGGHQLHLGAAEAALVAFDAALSYQADSPEALWGKAAALAQLARWEPAFALYEQALRLRTGLVALRGDYARDLLRAGRLQAARAQLKEARLLDPGEPAVLALQAWAALIEDDAAGALRQAEAALALGPWCDLARIIQGAAQARLGRPEQAGASWAPLRQRIAAEAPPRYVYRAESSAWLSVHRLPDFERALLRQLSGR